MTISKAEKKYSEFQYNKARGCPLSYLVRSLNFWPREFCTRLLDKKSTLVSLNVYTQMMSIKSITWSGSAFLLRSSSTAAGHSVLFGHVSYLCWFSLWGRPSKIALQYLHSAYRRPDNEMVVDCLYPAQTTRSHLAVAVSSRNSRSDGIGLDLVLLQ